MPSRNGAETGPPDSSRRSHGSLGRPPQFPVKTEWSSTVLCGCPLWGSVNYCLLPHQKNCSPQAQLQSKEETVRPFLPMDQSTLCSSSSVGSLPSPPAEVCSVPSRRFALSFSAMYCRTILSSQGMNPSRHRRTARVHTFHVQGIRGKNHQTPHQKGGRFGAKRGIQPGALPALPFRNRNRTPAVTPETQPAATALASQVGMSYATAVPWRADWKRFAASPCRNVGQAWSKLGNGLVKTILYGFSGFKA